MANVKPKPDGYNSVIPSLAVKGAARAIEFYKEVLGAQEVMRMPMPNGLIGHAELAIGDSKIMLADEAPEWGNKGPEAYGGSPVAIHVYVDDVDAVAEKAKNAGATFVMEVADQFYGDRSGRFVDPFGHVWSISTHIEDVSDEEMTRRMNEMVAQT